METILWRSNRNLVPKDPKQRLKIYCHVSAQSDASWEAYWSKGGSKRSENGQQTYRLIRSGSEPGLKSVLYWACAEGPAGVEQQDLCLNQQTDLRIAAGGPQGSLTCSTCSTNTWGPSGQTAAGEEETTSTAWWSLLEASHSSGFLV